MVGVSSSRRGGGVCDRCRSSVIVCCARLVVMHPTDRRKRKHYYVVQIGVGELETGITTGDMCMVTSVVGGVCEGRQQIGRSHAARLLCAYRRGRSRGVVVRVRGVAWAG